MSTLDRDVALEHLAHTQTAAEHARDASTGLLELVRTQEQAPSVERILFTLAGAGKTYHEDGPRVEEPTRSVGIINLSSIPVYFGLDGGSPNQAAGAFPIGPGATIVLPITAVQIELGVDPNQLAGAPNQQALVFLIRFPSVQRLAAGPAQGGGAGAAVSSSAYNDVSGPIGIASAQVLPANAQRLGSSWENDSANLIYLGLGQAAVIGKGIRLAAAGGSWDGRLGGATWRGTVNAIAAAAGSNLLAGEGM